MPRYLSLRSSAHLLDKLNNAGNELVVFDINRNENIIPFVNNDPYEGLKNLFSRADMRFRLYTIDQCCSDSFSRPRDQQRKGITQLTNRQLELAWPGNIYSLSHVALPFSVTDSLYGAKPENKAGLHIGRMSPRGERNVLSVPASDSLRLRYNPFYLYLQQRIVSFLAE